VWQWANSSSASQDVPHSLWNLTVHCRVHNSPPLVSVLSTLSHSVPAIMSSISILKLRSAFVWDIMQRPVVIVYRRFGTIYRSLLGLLTREDGTDTLSRTNYHTASCNIPEEHRSYQHRGGSLISRLVHFKSILPSMPRSSKQSLSFRMYHLNPVCISHLPHTCHMPSPSYPPWLHHPRNIWWTVQIMMLLTKHLSPVSCYFLPRRSNRIPQPCSSITVKDHISHTPRFINSRKSEK
jgi:hypothetical protein